jgi:hypothetical protein
MADGRDGGSGGTTAILAIVVLVLVVAVLWVAGVFGGGPRDSATDINVDINTPSAPSAPSPGN